LSGEGSGFQALPQDWVIFSPGRVYSVGHEEFPELFVSIPGRKNIYVEKMNYQAKQMNKAFSVISFGREYQGNSGDFLIQGFKRKNHIFLVQLLIPWFLS